MAILNSVTEIKFGVVKEERKALVMAISEIEDWEPIYKGAPSFAFVVGNYTIDRHGTLIYDERVDEADARLLLTKLVERGFAYEGMGSTDSEDSTDLPTTAIDAVEDCVLDPASDNAPEAESDTCSESAADQPPADQPPITSSLIIGDKLAIEVPLENFTHTTLSNLERLITAKGWILKKIAGTECLRFEVLEDRIHFPWFTAGASAEEVKAYSHLITRLCETAKTKRRVMAEERLPQSGDNEKYKARCFLLALDFKGSEYSQTRKILLAPFPGNGSFLQGSSKKEMPAVVLEEV